MNKKNCFFSFVLSLALSLAACSETEEVGRYDNWQARNEAFIDSIANVCNSEANKALPDTDPEKLYPYLDETNNRWIYVKKRISGDGTEQPVYTSTISAHYRMSYINGDIVQQTFTEATPTEFDIPAEFALNGVISGWSYSLVNMKVGDLWTLYIPYQSGYGSGTGSDGSLQAYSALIYDVKLEKIVEK